MTMIDRLESVKRYYTGKYNFAKRAYGIKKGIKSPLSPVFYLDHLNSMRKYCKLINEVNIEIEKVSKKGDELCTK